MNIEETVPLMLSDDPKQRLKAELTQLEIRIQCLNDYLETESNFTLGKIQLESMEIYRMCLLERIRKK